MTTHKNDSKSYWSNRAEEFSTLRQKELENKIGTSFKKFFEKELAGYSKVLDLGTGAGFFAILLRKLDKEVSAIDFSKEMLKEAEQNEKRYGVFGIDFKEMDASELQFEDASFDAVVTRNVTWILEDVEKVYTEVYRVLKSGGKFINIDANYGREFKISDDLNKVPTHPTQSLEQLRERNRLSRDLEITAADRPKWDGQFLKGLGFEVEIIEDVYRKLSILEQTRDYRQVNSNNSAEIFAIVAKKKNL